MIWSKLGLIAFWVAVVSSGFSGYGGEDLDAASRDSQDWWSLRPLSKPQLPSVNGNDWVRSPVDTFVLAKQEQAGLRPAPEADKRVFLRRVSFDLIGLPPTPEELRAFQQDTSYDAYAKVVDRLLASPRYGERWARHWMDLVHFAETHGHDQDRIRTNAWPYRDYLIQSFNADKPYGRFVEEQVAGDVLYPEYPAATVAMGFLATGPWDESSLRDIREDSIDREIARYIDRDDIVMTTMTTFTSTTAHCARCHDHKFDPISQEEYYGLQAVFAATDKANRTYDLNPEMHTLRQLLLRQKAELEMQPKEIIDRLLSSSVQADVAAWEESLAHERLPKNGPGRQDNANLDLSEFKVRSFPVEISTILSKERADRTREEYVELTVFQRGMRIDEQLKALPPPLVVYAGASDYIPDGSFKPARTPRPVHLLRRGNINRPGPSAVAGALSCVPALESPFRLDDPRNEGERRAALAKWISSPENPLTWRSIVNRIWQYHFGRGIVDTPSDFGRMGSKPTHPKLLDWLAVHLLESGESLKELHRIIVLSSVYRQSSRSASEFADVDSDNVLLWRMNRTRLDAESVHDAVLQISGKMDLRMGGVSAKHFALSPGIHVTPIVDYLEFDLDSHEAQRRSVYRFLFRTLPDPFMDVLDCADSSQLTAKRNSSVTPLQALSMLNNPFIVRYSEHVANRVSGLAPRTSDQVGILWRLAVGRDPSADESALLNEYVETHGLTNACRIVFNSNEFMFVN